MMLYPTPLRGRLCCLIDDALDHRSLPPEFESRRGHIWSITFGGRSAHLTYHVQKHQSTSSSSSSSSSLSSSNTMVKVWNIPGLVIGSSIFSGDVLSHGWCSLCESSQRHPAEVPSVQWITHVEPLDNLVDWRVIMSYQTEKLAVGKSGAMDITLNR